MVDAPGNNKILFFKIKIFINDKFLFNLNKCIGKLLAKLLLYKLEE